VGRTGLVTSPACLRHDPGPGHPERAERLIALLERLERCGLRAELDEREAPAAPLEALERVHPRRYVERLRSRIAGGASWVDTPDANVSAHSLEAALAAAGGALCAVDAVAAGDWKNAFVAARPPGHHAEEDLAMGFCLLNSVAIAARHLQAEHAIERVAIVDFDVHHGNGTQHLFEEDASVFYASLHEHPLYPGTGAASERGRGAGAGATLNCPMPPGSGDAEWLSAFEGRVLPALEDFEPGFVLVSAGFDGHARDPLSSTRLSEQAYASMTRELAALAARSCAGRLVTLLEGGYDLEGLARSCAAHVGELVGSPDPDGP